MLILRESDISPILTHLTRDQCTDLLQALWQALARYSFQDGDKGGKRIHQPIRENITTSRNHVTLFMPASNTDTATGIKIVTLPGNGGPPKGAINVFSPEGDLEGVLNAELITAFRTALATMIPFRQFPLPDDASILVFGAGKQAEWHIRLALLLAGEKIARVTIVNRSSGSLAQLKKNMHADMRQMFPAVVFEYVAKDSSTFSPDHLGRIVSQADCLFCCTPSTQPLFPASYLNLEPRPRFISLIGSYKPGMQEVDSETLLSAENTILVDSKEACLHEAGEIIKAQVPEGQLVEIGELLANHDLLSKTFAPGKNAVFKCVGMGIMDLVVGQQLLAIATKRQMGIVVDEF
ncbi:hypothetical protein LOZ12_006588 [Ophidiomyces ophidiicola]|uniref:Uncharacterized protein n=1 Tax=Ophidiomyces ophidiicola TaxID=1387563 RepID=A0ACB8UPQ3_9EURO|nr:uncharacterized protein LOZ57_002408 [Ophidiomyces ophidiicola]KAI1905831.1 hypothetical protein LOZ64_006597 [Ophidiomyces ophidiicola]KAI1906280.1 hypothetical protein LOZ61_006755 [Ophidiomyces ophidiicola]KAI1920584.1 hypothetical protein LOZ60_006529 [Ophidiomyces ophidiicola]KAI1932743.1 hypothetical protein LOZ62_006580 [Ophidiomyces ophidiicola]KAI1947052.1 hypothetical protein LOZ59_006690 [Ophidiomyces ophidiicola]